MGSEKLGNGKGTVRGERKREWRKEMPFPWQRESTIGHLFSFVLLLNLSRTSKTNDNTHAAFMRNAVVNDENPCKK